MKYSMEKCQSHITLLDLNNVMPLYHGGLLLLSAYWSGWVKVMGFNPEAL